MNTTMSERWAAVDWGDSSHAVCIVDAEGKQVTSFTIEHTAEQLDQMVLEINQHGPIAGVAVETDHGLLIVKLLEANLAVYAVNPKLSDQWRGGSSVAGAKSDAADSFTLADGLRTHHALLHPLQPDDPLTRELRGFCRHEMRLIQERTAEIEKLKAALKEYYPEALAWFDTWTCPAAWDFIVTFPTPQDLREAKTGKFLTLLKHHRMKYTPRWRQMVADRSGQAAWPADPVVTHVQSHVALDAIAKLQAIERSIKQCRKHIDELFAKHPDADIFKSLPGAGKKLAPRLLADMGSQRDRYESALAVQQISGVAPVTRASGKSRLVKIRWACRKVFRHNLYWLASCSRKQSAWAQAFYDLARARGDSHALALRKLGYKLLKIIFRLWQDRQVYDEQRYVLSLRQHGSPLAAAVSSSTDC
jgi:transposase